MPTHPLTSRLLTFAVSLAALLAVSLVAQPTARAGAGVDTDAVSEDTVMSVGKLLKIYDGVIPGPDRVARVADDPALALMAVHDDDRLQDQIRAWALTALTQFAEDRRVFAYLSSAVDTYESDAEAFRGVAFALGQAFGADAVDVIAPHIAARDLDVRVAAVNAIGLFGGEPGLELLRSIDRSRLDKQVDAAIATYTVD